MNTHQVPRQEVLNVLLAELLEEQHALVAIPEQIVRAAGAISVSLPDVMVDFRGLRLNIEAEFESTPQAEREAFEKARRRVENGLAHIGMAVVYPASLRDRHDGIAAMKTELARVRLRFALVTEPSVLPTQTQILTSPTTLPPFISGTLDDLAESLRRSYEQLVQDEVLERALAILEAATQRYLGSLSGQPATAHRFAEVLGIRQLPSARTRAEEARQLEAVDRIAALIITNALIFQEVMAKTDRRVLTLHELRAEADLAERISTHWDFILREINYQPIFDIARQLVLVVAADRRVTDALQDLISAAHQIVTWQAPLRHDLAGRIYHRHLENAKYLGARYTSISAAALLLKLSIPNSFVGDWTSVEQIGAMQVADLSCGTGTLLMAAADTLVDNYLRVCAAVRQPPRIAELHSAILNRVIHGFDVLQSAVHLTASTLALRVPDTPIDVTRLSRLPYGGTDRRLGSLEFIEGREISVLLYSRGERVTGRRGEGTEHRVILPDLDLCVMNPPFVSSRQPNLLFGTEPPEERAQMRAKLGQLVRRHNLPASITAGLGAVFAAIGDKYVKVGGRLSLVLPRTILSGVAWESTRKFLSESYHVEYIVISQEPNHWNFSEHTEFSEALVVARKVPQTEENNRRTIFLNLWRQPANATEALSVASSLIRETVPDIRSGQGAAQIKIDDKKYGEAVSLPSAELRDDIWGYPASFAQSELIRALFALREGRLYLPGRGLVSEFPICRLEQLGSLGPDPRDVYDGFSLAPGPTSYPALWGHDVERISTMDQHPNRFLEPLAQALPRRPLRRTADLWPRAGRVLIAQRTWLQTKKVTAVRLPERALGDVWVPFSIDPTSQGEIEVLEKCLVLWLNSTLGLIVLLGNREETRGAWIQFKQPVLERMLILDPLALSSTQRQRLASTYDDLGRSHLQAFPGMAEDTVRHELDQRIAEILGLEDFPILRSLLSREPVICLTLNRLVQQEAEQPDRIT